MNAGPNEIADSYRKEQSKYKRLADKVADLLQTLLSEKGIQVHSITFREKDPNKLHEKLTRPGKQYAKLEDVTDLAGVRVITYLPEDVDRVAQVVTSEFNIDEPNSVDKRHVTDPAKFGYASLHKVCSINEQRLSLAEYKPFRGLKCEIQIRTILQHAWAEIEHDLGYKSTLAVPDDCRRRFSRLAALLELADEEFERLKDSLSNYAREAKNRIEQHRPGVPLDYETLRLFVETNEQLRSLEKLYLPSHAPPRAISPDTLNWLLEKLKLVGVDSIDALDQALKRHQQNIPKGDSRCAQVDYGRPYCTVGADPGQPIWMLVQLICAEKPTKKETMEAYKKIGLVIPDSLDAYADSLRAIVRGEKLTVTKYKALYVTITDKNNGASYPTQLRDDKWVYQNVWVTDHNVQVDPAATMRCCGFLGRPSRSNPQDKCRTACRPRLLCEPSP
jgi:putative GTP pyrophosphokinase